MKFNRKFHLDKSGLMLPGNKGLILPRKTLQRRNDKKLPKGWLESVSLPLGMCQLGSCCDYAVGYPECDDDLPKGSGEVEGDPNVYAWVSVDSFTINHSTCGIFDVSYGGNGVNAGGGNCRVFVYLDGDDNVIACCCQQDLYDNWDCDDGCHLGGEGVSGGLGAGTDGHNIRFTSEYSDPLGGATAYVDISIFSSS